MVRVSTPPSSSTRARERAAPAGPTAQRPSSSPVDGERTAPRAIDGGAPDVDAMDARAPTSRALGPGPVVVDGVAQGGAPSSSGVGSSGGVTQARLARAGRPKATGARAPMRKDTAALVARAGLDDGPRLGRPKERLLGFVAKLDTLFAPAKSGADVATLLEKGDHRLLVFYLEGILKLYRKGHADVVEPLYERVKGLEDHAGAYAAALTTRDAGREKGLPASALAILDDEVATTRRALEAWAAPFAGQGGLAPALKDLATAIAGLPLPSYVDDKRALTAELVRRAEKATGEFDIDTLQGDEGLHELRRQLRWTLLYCTVGDGMIALDDTKNPIPHYTPLLSSGIGDTKYGKLPPPDHEDQPIPVSQSVFFALNRLVTEIGELKDQGELIESFAAVLEKGSGLDAATAHRDAVRLVTGRDDGDQALGAKAHALYDEIRIHRPVDAFLADLRRGVGETADA